MAMLAAPSSLELHLAEEYCAVLALARSARKQLKRQGLVVKRANGSSTKNPLISIAKEARSQAMQLAKDLGLGRATGEDLDEADTGDLTPERYRETESFLFAGKPPAPLPRPPVQLVAPLPPVVSAPSAETPVVVAPETTTH